MEVVAGTSDPDARPFAEVPASPFRSILFDRPDTDAPNDDRHAPDFFADLHLDEIVGSITAGRDIYALKPFFYAPVRSVATILYRQEVFRDLEDETLIRVVRSFAEKMRAMRERIGRETKVHYALEKERWFLDAADVYCVGVRDLTNDLTLREPHSRGLIAFRDYLATYKESAEFISLEQETQHVKERLGGIVYRLQMSGDRIRVSRYASEPDYSAEILRAFERFKQGAVDEYRFEISSGPEMNHVEAAILERVARLYPEAFASLDEYCARNREYLDPTIGRFDRELQFYVAYLEYMEHFRAGGLSFCYPQVASRSKETCAADVYDLALAERLLREKVPVVTNDFHLDDPERVLVVSGPNQGGKTTLARTVGQLHHLAAIGCPVPGSDARLFLVDRIFAHFEREEHLQNLSGKLEDDLRRIHAILEQATSDSLLIMNESFGSTTLGDALFLSREVLRLIIERDVLCACVTFLDELASLGPTTVSMVSTIDPADPAIRTFKIVRRPADGLAYAAAIAQKHGLTYERVKARVAP